MVDKILLQFVGFLVLNLKYFLEMYNFLLPSYLQGEVKYLSHCHERDYPRNTKHYKDVLGTSKTFYGRSQDVIVMLCVSRVNILISWRNLT